MGESEEKAKIVQCWEGEGRGGVSCSCNAAVQLGSRLSVVSEAFRLKLHFDISEENSFEYIVRPSPLYTSNTKQRLKNSSFSSTVDVPSSCGGKHNSVFQVDFYGLNGDVLACGLSRGKPGRKICLTGKAA